MSPQPPTLIRADLLQAYLTYMDLRITGQIRRCLCECGAEVEQSREWSELDGCPKHADLSYDDPAYGAYLGLLGARRALRQAHSVIDDFATDGDPCPGRPLPESLRLPEPAQIDGKSAAAGEREATDYAG